MNFSNGARLSSRRLTKSSRSAPQTRQPQDIVTVEWQSLLLDPTTAPVDESFVSSSAPELVLRKHHRNNDAVKDNLTGIESLSAMDRMEPAAIDQGAGTMTIDQNTIHAVHNAHLESNSLSSHALTVRAAQPAELSSISTPANTSANRVSMGPSVILASDSATEVVTIYLRQAQAYCEEEEWDKAFLACREILKVAPANAEAYKFLGKILQQQGRPTDAMGFYAKALTLRPNFPEVYSNMGSLYAKKGDWEDAVSYYKKAIESDPTFAVAYLNLAKVWKKLGRTENELNCLAKAYSLQPDLGAALDHFKMGQSLEAIGNREMAIDFYRQATAQDPKMIDAHQRLADLLEDSGDWQGAAVCYRKVVDLNAEAERLKAEARRRALQAKAAQQAQAALSQATTGTSTAVQSSSAPVQSPSRRLSPENQRLVSKLLKASTTQKLLKAPAAVSSPASEFVPAALPPSDDPTVAAEHYAKMKDWPNAIRFMQQAIAQSPRSAALYRSLAEIFDKSNNLKQAAETWYQSFVLDPAWPSPEQCFALGKVLARHNSVEAAVRCYRQAIHAQPEFAPAYTELAQLLRSRGNTAAADNILQQLAAVSGKKKVASAPASAPSGLAVPSAPERTTATGPLPSGTSSSGVPDGDATDSVHMRSLTMHKKGDSLKSQGRLEEALECYQAAIQLLETDSSTDSPNGAGSSNGTSPLMDQTASEQNLPVQNAQFNYQPQPDRTSPFEQRPQFGESPFDKDRLGKESTQPQSVQSIAAISQNGSLNHKDARLKRPAPADVQSAIAEAQSRALSAHKQGDTLREEKQWSEAKNCYQSAIQLNSEFSWSHHSLGDCYKNLGEFTQAVAAYRQAIALNPDFAWSYYSLGEVLEAQDKWNEAVEAYNKAVQLDPTSPQMGKKLADALKKSADIGLKKSALHYSQLAKTEGLDPDIYRQAIATNPQNTDAYEKLARVLQDSDQIDEAIFVYQTALQIDADQLDLRLQLVQLLAKSQQYPAAIDCVNQALALAPTSVPLHLRLGELLSQSGDLDAALEIFHRCLELDPSSYWAHQNIGNVYLWQGKADDAVSAFQSVIALNPELATAYKQMGDAFTALGKVEAATTAYAKAIELDPHVK